MSKNHCNNEKAVKENVERKNLEKLVENMDMNQISSLMNQIDLKDIDMDKINTLLNKMGLDGDKKEQLNALVENLNIGDLNNLDLSSIKSENINATLANLMDQIGNIGLNDNVSKENKNDENDFSNTLNNMMKTMEESEIYQQLIQYYSQQMKK